jgi:hypothetical protein
LLDDINNAIAAEGLLTDHIKDPVANDTNQSQGSGGDNEKEKDKDPSNNGELPPETNGAPEDDDQPDNLIGINEISNSQMADLAFRIARGDYGNNNPDQRIKAVKNDGYDEDVYWAAQGIVD